MLACKAGESLAELDYLGKLDKLGLGNLILKYLDWNSSYSSSQLNRSQRSYLTLII